jgi:hypothetical protein
LVPKGDRFFKRLYQRIITKWIDKVHYYPLEPNLRFESNVAKSFIEKKLSSTTFDRDNSIEPPKKVKKKSMLSETESSEEEEVKEVIKSKAKEVKEEEEEDKVIPKRPSLSRQPSIQIPKQPVIIQARKLYQSTDDDRR